MKVRSFNTHRYRSWQAISLLLFLFMWGLSACPTIAPPLDENANSEVTGGGGNAKSDGGTRKDQNKPDKRVTLDRVTTTDNSSKPDSATSPDDGKGTDSSSTPDTYTAPDQSGAPDQGGTIDTGNDPDLGGGTDVGGPVDRGIAPGGNCKNPCDCQQGLDCQQGRCTRTSLPIYCCEQAGCLAGETCIDRQGQTKKCPAGPSCKTHCDCDQGKGCFQGQCQKLGSPIYCCAKKNCPSGIPCYDQSGSQKTCPGSTGSASCKHACDCPQGQACLNGSCYKGQYPNYCCDKPGCVQGQSCQWRVGGYGNCKPTKVQCKNSCDCKFGEICYNGVCTKSQSKVYCCKRDKNICPPGYGCIDENGGNKLCGSQKSCRNTCDCPEKEVCFNGACIGSQRPTPCCKSQNCPKGSFCIEPTGSFGLCK